MAGNYGAIAEGFFQGVGFLSSKGRGGVDKDGNLREKACTSMASARLSALKSIANKLRFGRNGDDVWVEFKNLSDDMKKTILNEVNSQVRWESFGPNISRVSLQYADFEVAYLNRGLA